MRNIVLILVVLLQTTMVMAKDEIYAVTKSGVIVDYRVEFKYGKKVQSKYIRVATKSAQESDGGVNVTYSLDYLNQKKEIQKGTNMTDGMLVSFSVKEDGSYYLQDLMFGVGKDLVRNGFKLHIPGSLNVGDVVESGRCYGSYKWLGNNNFDIDFTDFKVVAEESVDTPIGTLQCFKIEGKMKSVINRTATTNYDHTLWIAPNIGVVKMDYLGTNMPFNVVIDSITGL